MNVFGSRGGSLNEIEVFDDVVIKSYSGNIPRGFEKLKEEANYLRSISNLNRNGVHKLFPRIIDLKENSANNTIELIIERINGTALSKLILSNQINSLDAQIYVDYSMEILFNQLYRLKNGRIDPKYGYLKYHTDRILLSRKYLRRLPYLEPILSSSSIYVNGELRPSFNSFLRFLDENANQIFKSDFLVLVHGNFHLDNILIIENEEVSKDNLIFIDPRGDKLGYPHYDVSKILITLEGYYDEIHYDKYELNYRKNGKAFEFNLNIDSTWSSIYRGCLRRTIKHLDSFHKLESNYTKHEYIVLLYSSVCIHILSFVFYHAFRTKPDTKRIRAYFALFFIFVDKLFKIYKAEDIETIFERRLLEN